MDPELRGILDSSLKDIKGQLADAYGPIDWNGLGFDVIGCGDRGCVFDFGDVVVKVPIWDYYDEDFVYLFDGENIEEVMDRGDVRYKEYIVNVIEYGEEYVVMEKVEGTLYANLSSDEKEELKGEIKKVLHHWFWRGIEYEDVHGGNIIVYRENGEVMWKLIDWGDVTFRERDRVTEESWNEYWRDAEIEIS